VPDDRVSWSVPFAGYDPPDYTAQVVLDNDRTKRPADWAEQAKRLGVPEASRYWADPPGRPAGARKNPMGRTGLQGRGLLGKWEDNKAADPIVTRYNPTTGQLEMAAIRRPSGEWAIAGGMVDEGELISATLGREFEEETGAKLDMSSGKEVYRGHVDDPRNTDDAWMETTVMHRHLDADEAAKVTFSDASVQSGETTGIRWMPITDEELDKLYASHGDFVRRATAGMPRTVTPSAPAAAAAPATRALTAADRAQLLEGTRRKFGDWEADRSVLDKLPLKSLQLLAVHYGLPKSGSKGDLAARIGRHLDEQKAS
jgi:ADP-ribose pyrophosphatase